MPDRVPFRSLSGLGAALIVLVVALPLSAARRHRPLHPCTIVLVRHAEKQVTQDEDPPLSEAGAARALALARHFEHAGVTHLFATEWRRTKETLAPLAKATGLQVESMPAKDSAALLAALSRLPPRSVAVVAGHSNTIPVLVEALAGDGRRIADLADGDHGRVFIVTQWGAASASVLELRY